MAACGTEFKERALTRGRKSGPQQISALQGRSAALPHGKKKNNSWISLSQAIQPSVCLLELPLPSLQLYITHRHNFLLLAALVQGVWSSLMGRESSSDHSQRWDPRPGLSQESKSCILRQISLISGTAGAEFWQLVKSHTTRQPKSITIPALCSPPVPGTALSRERELEGFRNFSRVVQIVGKLVRGRG